MAQSKNHPKDMAKTCRRLAQQTTNQKTAHLLNKLAKDYDEIASAERRDET